MVWVFFEMVKVFVDSHQIGHNHDALEVRQRLSIFDNREAEPAQEQLPVPVIQLLHHFHGRSLIFFSLFYLRDYEVLLQD